jgi:hypothetical protein
MVFMYVLATQNRRHVILVYPQKNRVLLSMMVKNGLILPLKNLEMKKNKNRQIKLL